MNKLIVTIFIPVIMCSSLQCSSNEHDQTEMLTSNETKNEMPKIDIRLIKINTVEPPQDLMVYGKYEANWGDLDKRPLPEWYDRAKIGIVVHWGIYSVPAFINEWFWHRWKTDADSAAIEFMQRNFRPNFSYQNFAHMFTADSFDPNNWAELFHKAGAKYVILTAKHHDGFALFPSKQSYSWNSVDIGPHCDIVGEVAQAVRHQDLRFGIYYSLYEWYNPLYLRDKKDDFVSNVYCNNKVWPDLHQLVEDYKPSIIWSDGDWEASEKYWQSTQFLAWLYNESPVQHEVVVNDRWGQNISCHHGDFWNCKDRFNPKTLQKHKWENVFSIDKLSWGIRRNISLIELLTVEELLTTVISTVSCGGNALINVGPTRDGTIIPIFQERLLQLGDWLHMNGESIYGTSPWLHQQDSFNGDVWYTCLNSRPYNGRSPTAIPNLVDKLKAIYAIFVKWPDSNHLIIKDIATTLEPRFNFKLQLLDGATNKSYSQTELTLPINHLATLPNSTVIVSLATLISVILIGCLMSVYVSYCMIFIDQLNTTKNIVKPYQSEVRELLYRMIDSYRRIKQQKQAVVFEKQQCLHEIELLAG